MNIYIDMEHDFLLCLVYKTFEHININYTKWLSLV